MKIFMIGDSTMKNNNAFRYPQTGWGQVMQIYVNRGVVVEDHAENGRSTKSFIAEGRFDIILDRMTKGDYVICQFGHNDEKIQDSNRYTKPYEEYQQNLKYFADKTLERGGHIVFATSITRHKFIDGACVNTHGDYPKAMLDFCKENGYTCIDLNQLTIDLYNRVGEEKSKEFHMIFPAGEYTNYINGSDDHSHLMYKGANMIARLFVEEIYKTEDPIKECLMDLSKPEPIDWNMLAD